MEFSEEYMYTDGRRHERVFLPTAEQEQHQTQLLSMFPAGNEPYQPHDAVPTQSFQYIREEEHEHLFYKVVTPSDVGKLNRLVIPKQHAERCFPLDPCLRKKGRFLSFQETVTGKIWWFRYSYWNSSQSYVFTKGWIRFVKENKLCAGDIVSFERSLRENFYYISCRKRPRPSSSSEMDTLAMATSLEQQRYVWNEEDDGSSSSSQMKMEMNTVHHTPPSSTRLFGVELAAP